MHHYAVDEAYQYLAGKIGTRLHSKNAQLVLNIRESILLVEPVEFWKTIQLQECRKPF